MAKPIILPDNIQAARGIFQIAFPYFSYFHWSMTPVAAPGLGTMATDKYWRLYLDLDVIKTWPVADCVLALLHEVLHIINKHFVRLPDNIAADLEINSWIAEILPNANSRLHSKGLKVELKLPQDWLHPNRFNFPKNLILEEYHKLLEKLPKTAQSGCGTGAAGAGSQSGKKSKDKPQVGNGNCGSCASGEQAPWEQPGPEEGGAPGLSPEQVEVRIRQTAQQIVDHAKQMGSMPGCLERWAITQLTPPKISWAQELAGATRYAINWAAGAVQRTWKTPSRRSPEGIIFPGMKNPIPNLAMSIDTSGSMNEQNLRDCLSEAQGVLRSCGSGSIPILAVDAAVHACKAVYDVRKFPLVGGGGTDMGVGIAAMRRLKPMPQIGIVFTDGYTDWPATGFRDMKVIAVLVTRDCQKPPDWIRSIHVHKE